MCRHNIGWCCLHVLFCIIPQFCFSARLKYRGRVWEHRFSLIAFVNFGPRGPGWGKRLILSIIYHFPTKRIIQKKNIEDLKTYTLFFLIIRLWSIRIRVDDVSMNIPRCTGILRVYTHTCGRKTGCSTFRWLEIAPATAAIDVIFSRSLVVLHFTSHEFTPSYALILFSSSSSSSSAFLDHIPKRTLESPPQIQKKPEIQTRVRDLLNSFDMSLKKTRVCVRLDE